MTTISERIQQRAEIAAKWENATGLDWEQTYSKNEPKIYLTKELLSSPAYRSLSAAAMLIYQDFLAKRDMRCVNKRWICANNGRLMYPYSEAEVKGFSRRTFRNAIDELQIKGLIDITHIGKGGRKPENGEGDPTMYGLDMRWQEYDETNKRAIKAPHNPRQPDTRSDRGFKLYWANVRLLAIIGYVQARCKQILSIKSVTGFALNR